MSDQPNPRVIAVLDDLQANIHNYDVSTFKEKLRYALKIVDDRPKSDQTDFSFKARRTGEIRC